MRKGLTAALLLGALAVLSGCARSDQDIRRLAQESITTVLASLPTLTPAPTATPQPTPTPVTIPPIPTPITLPPPPTPQPTRHPATDAHAPAYAHARGFSADSHPGANAYPTSPPASHGIGRAGLGHRRVPVDGRRRPKSRAPRAFRWPRRRFRPGRSPAVAKGHCGVRGPPGRAGRVGHRGGDPFRPGWRRAGHQPYPLRG